MLYIVSHACSRVCDFTFQVFSCVCCPMRLSSVHSCVSTCVRCACMHCCGQSVLLVSLQRDAHGLRLLGGVAQHTMLHTMLLTCTVFCGGCGVWCQVMERLMKQRDTSAACERAVWAGDGGAADKLAVERATNAQLLEEHTLLTTQLRDLRRVCVTHCTPLTDTHVVSVLSTARAVANLRLHRTCTCAAQ